MILLITRQIFHWGFLSMASIIKQINLTNMPVKQLVTQEAEFAP